MGEGSLEAQAVLYLNRCVELAGSALRNGDQPFGSVLVSSAGRVLYEDTNHEGSGDGTQHPEFAIARWAAQNLDAGERASATVYTSGEHCPMCAAAHAWVGLGPIVFATSSEQTSSWYEEFGAGPSPVAPLPIRVVAPSIHTSGPFAEYFDEVGELHRRRFGRDRALGAGGG